MFNKNIKVLGKHSYYMDELKNKNFFSRHLDVYIHAALIGFQYNRKALPDKSSEYASQDRTIFLEQILNEVNNLDFIFRLIILMENSDNLSLDERVTRAFRDDSISSSEQHNQNLLTFNSYVLGGMEVLYEKIIVQGTTELDYIKNSIDFMKEYQIAIEAYKNEDLLNDL